MYTVWDEGGQVIAIILPEYIFKTFLDDPFTLTGRIIIVV